MRSLLAVFFGLVIALAATLLALPPSAAPAALAAAAPPAHPLPAADPTLAGPATAAQVARGGRVYRTLCLACHLPDGKGMAGLTPPLAESDFLFADRTRAVRLVLKGQTGAITVNGVTYQGLMPGLESVLTDTQVADVLTYVFNSWGNTGDAFDAAHIATLRRQWFEEPTLKAPPTTLQ